MDAASNDTAIISGGRPEHVGVQAVNDAAPSTLSAKAAEHVAQHRAVEQSLRRGAPIAPLEKNAAVVARCTARWSGW